MRMEGEHGQGAVWWEGGLGRDWGLCCVTLSPLTCRSKRTPLIFMASHTPHCLHINP